MKKNYFKCVCVGVSLILLGACSSTHSVKAVENQGSQGIDEIDNLIVNMKNNFYKECYEPLLNEPIPENACQHQLFGLLERRYRLKFEDKFMAMAANDAFFETFKKEVGILIRSNSDVRKSVQKKYNSMDELLTYYHDLYKFEAN